MKMKVLWMCVIGAMLSASAMAAPIPIVKVNFQLSTAATPSGYLPDSGLAFGDRGNGWTYGWSRDISADSRERNVNADKRYDTLLHFQKGANAVWEIVVPNGQYVLFMVCGDASNTDQTNTLDVEGQVITDPTPQSGNFDEYNITGIVVSDGRLTIQPATGASNAKICFVDISLEDPKFNPAPVVDAGPNQAFAKPTFPLVVQMNGTVTDEDPQDPTEPRGVISYAWTVVSGPAGATISNAAIEDPTVTVNQPGEYVMKLVGSDGSKQTEDTMTIYVNDVSKNMLMAHWNFESLTTTNKSVIDVAKGNNGVWTATEPNQVPTIVPGWITGSTQAVDFRTPAANPPIVKTPGPGQVNVTIADTEPNFVNTPRYAITISAWIKVSAFSKDYSAVVSKGDTTWRLARYSNTNMMSLHLSGVTRAAGQAPDIDANGPRGRIAVNDNFWHHVCGTYDGEKMRLYIDGVLDNEGLYTGLINTNTNEVRISENSGATGRQWDGILDEVKIYNYALSETEVRAMTAQGKTVPFVDAGTISSPLTYKTGEQIPLNGRVLDYGTPGTVTTLWTTVSGPEDAEAIFANPSSPATTVLFPKFGQYTLRLTGADDLATVIDEITVDVVRPTCADVKTAKKLMVGDFDENCRVNLEDFAILAADWMRCNDPANYPACFWPFPQ